MRKKRKNKSEEKILEEKEPSKPVKKKEKVESVISFDVYFRKMLNKNKNVQVHHKAPMKAFAQKRNLLNATLSEFEKLFSSY